MNDATKTMVEKSSAEKTEESRMWSALFSSMSFGLAAGLIIGGPTGLIVTMLVSLGVFLAFDAIASNRPSAR